MMSIDREQEIEQQMNALRNELDEVRQEKRLKKFTELQGKFFKRLSNFSLPESEADYWYIYIRVMGVTDGGRLDVFSFQTDCNGTVAIERDTYSGVTALIANAEEITESEYRRAYESTMVHITGISTP